MKLTNPEFIQESEKEFIDTINAELDWDVIEQLLLDKHGFEVQDDIEYKDGNLVVYNNEIAYKFDFEIKVPLSVIFNRSGECMDLSTRKETPEEEANLGPSHAESDDNTEISVRPDKRKVEEMAVEIADLISEINNDKQ